MAARENHDCMHPDQLLGTLRGLVSEVHGESDGSRAAIKAVAAVHIVHILDVMLTAGHPLPSDWTWGVELVPA